MYINKLKLSFLLILLAPAINYAGVFPPDSGPILSCGAKGAKHYQVDVTLFPKTLRVDGRFLEFQSSTDANDGFKVGIYKQVGSSQNVMLAVRNGFKPVLIENGVTYICD